MMDPFTKNFLIVFGLIVIVLSARKAAYELWFRGGPSDDQQDD
jgi:hypothetical protein